MEITVTPPDTLAGFLAWVLTLVGLSAVASAVTGGFITLLQQYGGVALPDKWKQVVAWVVPFAVMAVAYGAQLALNYATWNVDNAYLNILTAGTVAFLAQPVYGIYQALRPGQAPVPMERSLAVPSVIPPWVKVYDTLVDGLGGAAACQDAAHNWLVASVEWPGTNQNDQRIHIVKRTPNLATQIGAPLWLKFPIGPHGVPYKADDVVLLMDKAEPTTLVVVFQGHEATNPRYSGWFACKFPGIGSPALPAPGPVPDLAGQTAA